MNKPKLSAQSLDIQVAGAVSDGTVRHQLQEICQSIIDEEGGENRSEKAKQAHALQLLMHGYTQNRDYISPHDNAIYPMEQFNFSTLQEAAGYARRGANSAVLKRIEYFCCDDLLKDGNVLVDTPGIDAPVRKDAELTYIKIQHPDTSAVVCILKTAETGELTAEETELLETIQNNPSIRDRVFYVFNRVDKTWYNSQLRQRLENCIKTQFRDTSRIYRTSGLLGFYGRLIQNTGHSDRFGLDSLFLEETQGQDGQEETPLFVVEFNNYCGSSGKLFGTNFKSEIRGYESPNQNYVRILDEYGTPLIRQMIQDSGVEIFRDSIINYLMYEKRPQLLSNLADDLHPLCTSLRDSYISQWQILSQQPTTSEAIKSQKLKQLASDLKAVGDHFYAALEDEVNVIVASDDNKEFEGEFKRLQSSMVTKLDDLIRNFSVEKVYQQAQASHRRNSVVPLLGILAEAFYYLANGLEETLVKGSQELLEKYFSRLIFKIREGEYYRDIYHLLGSDAGIEERLAHIQKDITAALLNEAKTECDRYVRERPEFYAESTPSIWQLRQTLQQACRGYDYQSMIDAEPAIRQLLKIDFEQKVKETILRTYRQTINQTLNVHLLQMAEEQRTAILQEYDKARDYLAQTLDREAEEKLERDRQSRSVLEQSIGHYNTAIDSINHCLEKFSLDRYKLPRLTPSEAVPSSAENPVQETENAIESPVLEAV